MRDEQDTTPITDDEYTAVSIGPELVTETLTSKSARCRVIAEHVVCWCSDFHIKSYIVFRKTRLSSSRSLI